MHCHPGRCLGRAGGAARAAQDRYRHHTAQIEATAKKTASELVSDQQLRLLNINGECNIGVGVVHRVKTAGRDIGGGIEHSQITEIYHVMSGNGTLVTDGTIENSKEQAADSIVVTTLNGPSSGVGKDIGGKSRRLGPGDVQIIPPNTPHWWTEITTDQIEYLVVRVDPHKVLRRATSRNKQICRQYCCIPLAEASVRLDQKLLLIGGT